MSTGDRSKLRLLGQIFGALGVIASLIFVAWEIRQNTEAIRSETIQAISEQSYNIAALIVQNDDLQEAVYALREGEKLSSQQNNKMSAFYAAGLRIHQNRFLQTELGILDIETALFLGGSAPMYRRPHFTEWWEEVAKPVQTKEFAEYFETHVMQLNSNGE